MNNSIYASFSSSDNARSALGALLDRGAHHEDISCVIRDESMTAVTHTNPNGQVVTKYIGNSDSLSGHELLVDVEKGISTTTSADAAAGATKGAEIGLGLGALAALAAITIPGVGLVIGGGALAMALGGAAATAGAGAIAGGVTGFLKDQGVPSNVIDQYTDSFAESAATITVSVPTGNLGANEVQDILAKYEDTQIWGADGKLVERRALAGAGIY